MKRTLFFPCVALLALASCAERRGPERVAEQFMSAYLDCRFQDAASLASPSVQDRVRWRASQLTQADLDLLADQSAEVETDDLEDYGDSAIVSVDVSDALLLDSIGQPGHIGDARYRLTLKKEKGSNWKVTALISNF
ncbi:MAG: hypothetical protein IJT19_06685 [Bacteroidaceae bacterium]|nr:hypothetical protein [Bacteroidaceae bacterium]